MHDAAVDNDLSRCLRLQRRCRLQGRLRRRRLPPRVRRRRHPALLLIAPCILIPKHIFPPSSRPGRQSRRRRLLTILDPRRIRRRARAAPCSVWSRSKRRCTHGNSGAESPVLRWTDIRRRRARPKTTGCRATPTPCARAAYATRPTTRAQGHPPSPNRSQFITVVSFGSARTTPTQKATHRSATSKLATTALQPRTATTTKSTCATTSPTFNGQSA